MKVDRLKLKVCGMREAANIAALDELDPDYVGFIFYPKSSRFVQDVPTVETKAKRVGVFVNAKEAEVIDAARAYQLDLLQLHGDESVSYVKTLHEAGYSLMKVFSVTDELPLDKMKAYAPFVSFFLFDTKTPKYGGSGQKFNWSILEHYNLDKPFFLSGGIDLEDIERIKALELPQLYAVDINSRFEDRPAFKNIEKVKAFKEAL